MAINTVDRVAELAIRPMQEILININDFRPGLSGVLNPGVSALRRSFYGVHAPYYYEAVLRGRSSQKLKTAVDREAIENVMSIWNLPDPERAKEFYINQLRTANKIVEHALSTTLPGWSQNYSLMEELESPSENPSDALKWSARAAKDGEEQLLYEVERQSLLAAVAGSINARTRGNRIGTVRDSIKDALFDIYERPVKPRPYNLVSEHDDQTGQVVGVGGFVFGSAASTHFRTREYMVRSIEGVGPVLVGDRKKGDPEAVLKAISKAKNKQIKGEEGWIDSSDSTDTFGIKLTVLDPGADGFDANVRKLQGLVIEHMRSQKKGARRLSNKIIGFETDDDTASGRSSSKHHNFSRLQMHLENISVPYEVVFQNPAQMRNDEVMHGEVSDTVLEEEQYQAFLEETGVTLKGRMFDGPAHIFYRAQKQILLLPTLFPAAIYGDRVIDQALDNLLQIEHQLKAQDRVDR